jgi:hypothetical protein
LRCEFEVAIRDLAVVAPARGSDQLALRWKASRRVLGRCTRNMLPRQFAIRTLLLMVALAAVCLTIHRAYQFWYVRYYPYHSLQTLVGSRVHNGDAFEEVGRHFKKAEKVDFDNEPRIQMVWNSRGWAVLPGDEVWRFQHSARNGSPQVKIALHGWTYGGNKITNCAHGPIASDICEMGNDFPVSAPSGRANAGNIHWQNNSSPDHVRRETG